MGITKIRTTPYHPMSNGFCENFNGVLKSMLKYASEFPKAWDKFIPYLLFAYREVPQASTGFSPFELLYGRQVPGPLDVLREAWTGDDPEQKDALQYILQIRDRLSSMMEIAHQNKESAQLSQKMWYDRAARDRSFQVGDKVLILLPSSAAKLQAMWQGPAVVTRKISDLDYEVDFGKRKPKKIYHANMLRKWHERKLDSFLAARVERVNDLDEQTKLPYVSDSIQTWQDVEISGKLTDEQRQSLSMLLHEYSSVLSSEPGCTYVITHSVLTTDEIPVRQRPYRIPQAMRNIVKSEIDKMLKSGYIEPANSPYGYPIVIVKKADSTWRFCIDYRRLNAKTLFDPQPMPQVDELIEKVSDAKYISTIDLAKARVLADSS